MDLQQKISEILTIIQNEYLDNKEDKDFLNRKYGVFFNFLDSRRVFLSGFNLLLKNNFYIDIPEKELIQYLDNIQSTNHMELIKAVNENNPDSIIYEIGFM